MHTRTAILLATALSLIAQTTFAQAPAPLPGGPSAPVPPLAAPPEKPPLRLKGRIGFGVGLWGAPGGMGSQAGQGAVGALGTPFGGALGLRWWASERVVLLPALQMGVSRISIPGAADGAGNELRRGTFTAGTFSPRLSVGFAAYRGKSTRLILSGGLGFGYSAQEVITQARGDDGAPRAQHQTARTTTFSLPVGLSLEQSFTPRLSGVLGAESPLLSYSASRIGDQAPTTMVGADFSSTRLGASIVFYTD